MPGNGQRHLSSEAIRLGYVPLIDAAPLLAARELRFYNEESLTVELLPQIGWGNVRDKLTFGHLDASHALLGMPPASLLGCDWFAEPLVAIMSLGMGGNCITLSRRLTSAGVNSAATLARHLRETRVGEPPSFAHVFSCSTHHYLLRDWLHSGGIDPDIDVRLCVMPPPQIPSQMARGWLDGFCVGEPWNSLAARQAIGSIVAVSTDLIPDHPEKILAVSSRWLERNRPAAVRLIRAILRACVWCDDPKNVASLAEILVRSSGMKLPRDLIESSLLADRSFAYDGKVRSPRPADWKIRSFAPKYTFPSATHFAWITQQMVRWGHVASDIDLRAIALQSVNSVAYREAAASLELECPADDFPPMKLRNGLLELDHETAISQQLSSLQRRG